MVTLVLHNAHQLAHDVINLIHKISICPAEFVIQQLYDWLQISIIIYSDDLRIKNMKSIILDTRQKQHHIKLKLMQFINVNN